MSDIQILINEIIKFLDVLQWEQFHNKKDLALTILIEAADMNELSGLSIMLGEIQSLISCPHFPVNWNSAEG